ncbi:MAG: hypothetical protein K0U66_09295 [Gammaproteobacteria bacterium]|nr:hypothetical protein [Pseudomonadota bacterium]MCH9663832.1 hypothetical protein [Gammaproteobacteria bacterium]
MSKLHESCVEDVRELVKQQLAIPVKRFTDSEGVRQMQAVMNDSVLNEKIITDLEFSYGIFKRAGEFEFKGYKPKDVVSIYDATVTLMDMLKSIQEFTTGDDPRAGARLAVRMVYEFEDKIKSVQYFT